MYVMNATYSRNKTDTMNTCKLSRMLMAIIALHLIHHKKLIQILIVRILFSINLHEI